MNIDSELEAFSDVIERNGNAIMQRAMAQVLESRYDAGDVSLAAKYHTRFLKKVLPVFPAILSISCEAVCGNKEKTIGIGAALTLFVEASNIHDDIIDQTFDKHKRKTTFAKFGSAIALLAGDLILVQAALYLAKECETLPNDQRSEIIDLTYKALAEISKSAAMETKMQRKFNISPPDYLEVVRLRASVPQIHCMIGGILGGGTKKMISYLGKYGKIYGVVGTVIDEFMDLHDYNKFSNRLKNECVPLPVLYSLKNAAIKEEIIPLLNKFAISKKEHDSLVVAVLGSEEVRNLQKETLQMLASQVHNIEKELVKSSARGDLLTLNKVVERLLCNIG